MDVRDVVTLTGVTVVLRPYGGVEDLPGIEAVRAAARPVDGEVWLPGPYTAEDPTVPQPFCVVAVTDAGHTVGFTWMDWWTEAAGTRIYLLSGCVDPGWRRRGVGGAMLRWQEDRAAELERTQPEAGSAVLAGNVAFGQAANLALLHAHGYRLAFTVVDMERDLHRSPPAAARPMPAGLVTRPVDPEHHPAIHAVIEECFAGAQDGYQARTYDEYLRDVQDADVWAVAWAGDEVAAVVVNELQPDGTALTPWVAVRPVWRRRGVGLALMECGLRALAARGVSSARLATVQENPHNSVGLYERAGYRVTGRQPRYRKPLAPRDGLA